MVKAIASRPIEVSTLTKRRMKSAKGFVSGPVPALAAAVRRFQARHGLEQTGTVGANTLAELNVPVSKRLRQLAASLDREKLEGRIAYSFAAGSHPAALDADLHAARLDVDAIAAFAQAAASDGSFEMPRVASLTLDVGPREERKPRKAQPPAAPKPVARTPEQRTGGSAPVGSRLDLTSEPGESLEDLLTRSAAINRIAKTAMDEPAVKQKLADQGLTLAGDTPAHFRGFIEAETVKWSKVVKDAGLATEK